MKISEMNLKTIRFDNENFEAEYSNLSKYDYITFNCDECGKEFTVHKYSFPHPLNKHICKGCKNRHFLHEQCDIESRTLKCKATKLARYGDANYNNSNKTKATCLDKYGCECSWQAKEVIEKCEKTREEKTGYKYYAQSPEAKQNLHDWITSDEFKQKSEETSMLHHGCKNGGGSKQAHAKMHRKYTYNGVNFDSSWELALYIYLIDNDIEFTYQPDIFFEYKLNDKTKRYFPDFIIQNKLYEVKGDHFFKNDKMINPFSKTHSGASEAKYQCMLANNVTILKSTELKPVMTYIRETHGKNYLSEFRNL